MESIYGAVLYIPQHIPQLIDCTMEPLQDGGEWMYLYVCQLLPVAPHTAVVCRSLIETLPVHRNNDAPICRGS